MGDLKGLFQTITEAMPLDKQPELLNKISKGRRGSPHCSESTLTDLRRKLNIEAGGWFCHSEISWWKLLIYDWIRVEELFVQILPSWLVRAVGPWDRWFSAWLMAHAWLGCHTIWLHLQNLGANVWRFQNLQKSGMPSVAVFELSASQEVWTRS